MSKFVSRWGHLAGLLTAISLVQADEIGPPRLKQVSSFRLETTPRAIRFSNQGKFLLIRTNTPRLSRVEYVPMANPRAEPIRVCEEKSRIVAAAISEPHDLLVYAVGFPARIQAKPLGVDFRTAPKGKAAETLKKREWSHAPTEKGHYRELRMAPNHRNVTALFESDEGNVIRCFNVSDGAILREVKVKRGIRLLDYVQNDSGRLVLSGGRVLKLVDRSIVSLQPLGALPKRLRGMATARHFAARNEKEIVGVLQFEGRFQQHMAVGVWDAQTGKFLRKAFETPGNGPSQFKVPANGSRAVYISGKHLCFLPLTGNGTEWRIPLGAFPARYYLSPDCRRLATLDRSGGVKMFAVDVSPLSNASNGDAKAGQKHFSANQPVDRWPLMGLPPYPCLGLARVLKSEVVVCLPASTPRLVKQGDAPAWVAGTANIFVKFPMSSVSLYRGSGLKIAADEIATLLADEQFVFFLPNGMAHAGWTRHLKSDAIVIRLPTRSEGPSYPNHFSTHVKGVGEKHQLVAHAFPRIEPLRRKQPRLQPIRRVYRTSIQVGKKPADEFEAAQDAGAKKAPAVGKAQGTVAIYQHLSISESSPPRPPSDYTRPGSEQLHFHRAAGQAIYSLSFISEAMRKGSYLVLDADQLFVPQMLTKVLRPDTIVLIRRQSSASRVERSVVDEKIRNVQRLLRLGDSQGARNALHSIPLDAPIWAGQFYQLAFFQHQRRKLDDAKESIRIAALLEWERELTDWALWQSKMPGKSGKWVAAERKTAKEALSTFTPPKADFPVLSGN